MFKISNEELDIQYAMAMSATSQLEVLLVLHGTSMASIDATIRHGFKVGGDGVLVRYGKAHGSGVYLSTNPKSAAKYALSSNCSYILISGLCRTSECVTKGELCSNSRHVINEHPNCPMYMYNPTKTSLAPGTLFSFVIGPNRFDRLYFEHISALTSSATTSTGA